MNSRIDVHSHILPGMDDGSRDTEESMSLLSVLYEQGFTGCICTPHYSRRSTDPGTRERIVKTAAELERNINFSLYQRYRAVSGGDEVDEVFRIYPGQELYWHEELVGRLRDGYGMTINNGVYALVEFDISSSYDTIYRAVRNLAAAGYSPVLAHIERYSCLAGSDEHIRELIRAGAYMQMNYESLMGSILSSEVRRCRRLCEKGLIHLLGTDCHRTDFRPPDTGEAIRWLQKHVPEEEIRRMTQDNPLRMVNSEILR